MKLSDALLITISCSNNEGARRRSGGASVWGGIAARRAPARYAMLHPSRPAGSGSPSHPAHLQVRHSQLGLGLTDVLHHTPRPLECQRGRTLWAVQKRSRPTTLYQDRPAVPGEPSNTSPGAHRPAACRNLRPDSPADPAARTGLAAPCGSGIAPGLIVSVTSRHTNPLCRICYESYPGVTYRRKHVFWLAMGGGSLLDSRDLDT